MWLDLEIPAERRDFRVPKERSYPTHTHPTVKPLNRSLSITATKGMKFGLTMMDCHLYHDPDLS